MSVLLLGTIASGSETPKPIERVSLESLMEELNGIDHRMKVMLGKSSTVRGSISIIDGRMNNIEGCPNSTNSKP